MTRKAMQHEQRPPRRFRFGRRRRPLNGRRTSGAETGREARRVEGVFLMKDGKSEFAIVKTGTPASDTEVLSVEGRRSGHRTVHPCADVCRRSGEDRAKPEPRRSKLMSQLFFSRSCWRSPGSGPTSQVTLTLLGNIVAVSSIITVALITGVNAVTDAIVTDPAPIRSPSSGWASRRTRTTSSGCATTRWSPTMRCREAVCDLDRGDHGAGPDADPRRLSRRRTETLQVQGVSEEYVDFAIRRRTGR